MCPAPGALARMRAPGPRAGMERERGTGPVRCHAGTRVHWEAPAGFCQSA